MFRRKDEILDESTDSAQQNTTTETQQTVSNTAPQAASPVASRPASVATPVYRTPSSVSELGRTMARTANDVLRPATQAAQHAVNSLSNIVEKAATTKSNRRVLTVGNDILLKGEIATCDRLVIEGRVEAKLSDVHTVEIAECGSFTGTAEVEDAEISGIFEGDLIVRNRLVIYTTGEVRGNISYGEIEIERGGRLTGQIKTVDVAANAAAKSKLLDVLDIKPVARPLKEAAEA